MANPNRRSSFKKAFTFVSLADIPGPRGIPYLTYVRHFQQDILGAFTKVNRDYGDIASFPWPMNSVIIYSPDLVKQVLVDQGKSFIKGEQIEELRAVVGNGLATNNDHESWLRSRALLSKEFNNKAVGNFVNDFVAYTKDHIQKFKTETDICEEMKLLTFKIAAKTFLGADLNAEDAGRVNEAVNFTSKVTYERIFQIFPLPYWLPTALNAEFNRHFNNLEEIVMNLIRKERLQDSSSSGILQKLVHAKDDETNFSFTDQELRDEILTLLIAGHETSAHTLTWALGLLAKHQDIQEKLYLSLAHSSVQENELLKNVLLETMRLYPAFPVLSRKAAKDVVLGKYKIQSGTNVVIPIYVMQRNEDNWQDALLFNPSRFETISGEKSFSFLPFSKGHRRCIAELFAMTEMSVILSEILKNYKVELINGNLPPDVASVSLKPSGGLPLKLIPR